MAHHKRRKRKPFKGCCTLCSYRSTDGRRNGRRRTLPELRAELSEREQSAPWLSVEAFDLPLQQHARGSDGLQQWSQAEAAGSA